MNVVPLEVGDPSWVFDADVDRQVIEVLRKASDEIEQLARALNTRAGWTGSGLEYHVSETTASLEGFAELEDASFLVELEHIASSWEVFAEIAVRCDATVDCGMHTVCEGPARVAESPLAAAEAVLEAARWLSVNARDWPSTRRNWQDSCTA